MRLVPSARLALVLLGVLVPPASAAPPANDSPASAAAFEPYTARAGAPAERQALADLAEATPEAGIPPCLGPASFARTVWYRIDAAGAREITVEASGRTLHPVDLAAFVQPAAGPLRLRQPNACGGRGVAGADAAEDATSGVTLRVPPGRPVLVQVGRRGPVRGVEDEQVQLSLAAIAVPPTSPKGDAAGRSTPRIGRSGTGIVGLSGATTTEEDVATPRCTARATVWRRVRPRRSRTLTFAAEGSHVGTLAVFQGSRPTSRGFVDCVDRVGAGRLALPVKVRARRRYWVRLGTDRPPVGARARLQIAPASPRDRADGGGCLGNPRSVVGGELAGGPALAALRNRSRFVALSLRVARGPLCAAGLELRGPKRRVYARAEVAAVPGRGQIVVLRRTRRLVRGRYRLRVEAAGFAGVRVAVPSKLSFRLR